MITEIINSLAKSNTKVELKQNCRSIIMKLSSSGCVLCNSSVIFPSDVVERKRKPWSKCWLKRDTRRLHVGRSNNSQPNKDERMRHENRIKYSNVCQFSVLPVCILMVHACTHTQQGRRSRSGRESPFPLIEQVIKKVHKLKRPQVHIYMTTSTYTDAAASIKLNYYHDKSFPHNHKSSRRQNCATIASGALWSSSVVSLPVDGMR